MGYTGMTYRQFIDRPAELQMRIEHKIEDVQKKWTICQNTTPQLKERVQTSVANSTERSYIKYIEAKKSLDQLSEELYTAQDEIRDFLYENLSRKQADLLEWRYVDCKTVREIADIKEIGYNTIRQNVIRADKKAESIYRNKFGN